MSSGRRRRAATGQVVGDGLTAEQGAGGGPQVEGRSSEALTSSLRSSTASKASKSSSIDCPRRRSPGLAPRRVDRTVVLDRIGAHLLGAHQVRVEAARGVARATRWSEEGQVDVGFPLLDVGGVVGNRTGVVVVGVVVVIVDVRVVVVVGDVGDVGDVGSVASTSWNSSTDSVSAS